MVQTQPPPLQAPDVSHPPRWRWLQGVESLRYRDYRLVWSTSFLSSAARWIQQVSLGWLVFDFTGSALLLGSIFFVYQAPSVLLSPLVGVLIDRLDRRRLLMASQVTMAGVAALLAADVALGWVQVWHLFVFAFLSGLESTIIHVVRQALIPSVVPKAALMNAIALNSAALTSTRIGAPVLGGLLIVSLGVPGNFLLQAVLLLAVAAAAFPLSAGDTGGRGHGTVWHEVAVGFRYIWGVATLRLLFALQFLLMLLAMPFSSFLPVWSADVLKLDADGLGLLYAAVGVGALAGTLAVAWAGDVRRKGALSLAAAASVGAMLLGLGLAPWLLPSLVLLAVLGCAQSLFSTVNMTMVQSRVPADLQGRVMSVYNVGHSMIALGSLIMGGLVTVLGVQAMVMAVGVALLAVAGAFAVAMPGLRRL